MKHFSYSAFKQNINMHWMYSTLQCGWKQKWCYFHSNCILLTVISHECLSCTEQSDKAFRSHVYELTFMWGGWGEGGRQDSRETTVPDGFSTFGSAQPLVIIIRRHQDLFFFFSWQQNCIFLKRHLDNLQTKINIFVMSHGTISIHDYGEVGGGERRDLMFRIKTVDCSSLAFINLTAATIHAGDLRCRVLMYLMLTASWSRSWNVLYFRREGEVEEREPVSSEYWVLWKAQLNSNTDTYTLNV